jgi:dUTP pyrophosphatase
MANLNNVFLNNAINTIYNLYATIKNNNCQSSKRNFAILKVSVNDNSRHSFYESKIKEHNNKFSTAVFMDSGFDVFVPNDVSFDQQFVSKFIDMGIKTEMIYCEVATDKLSTCAFTVYPRSSISKTPLMLANHTGIIDSGYRGSLIGAFRLLSPSNYLVEKDSRLLQICHPTLCPIYVVLVNEDDLTTTERGSGGFGSTGI